MKYETRNGNKVGSSIEQKVKERESFAVGAKKFITALNVCLLWSPESSGIQSLTFDNLRDRSVAFVEGESAQVVGITKYCYAKKSVGDSEACEYHLHLILNDTVVIPSRLIPPQLNLSTELEYCCSGILIIFNPEKDELLVKCLLVSVDPEYTDSNYEPYSGEVEVNMDIRLL